MPIRTWQDLLRLLDTVDPAQLGNDVREALTWARHVRHPKRGWTPEQRQHVAQLFEAAFRIAVEQAQLSGPSLVRDVAVRAADERIESAHRFGSNTAIDAMSAAGYERADWDTDVSDVNRLTFEAVQRALADTWEFLGVEFNDVDWPEDKK